MTATRKLTVADVEWEVIARPEDFSPEDDLDEATHADLLEEIADRLNSGDQWAWCCVEVRGEFRGLTASDFLGGCCYRDAKEFTQPDGYYPQMQAEVLAQLQAQFDSLADWMEVDPNCGD